MRERTKGLVVPFLFFSIIVAAGYYFVEDNYREFICNLLKNGWGGYALWFVPVLLLAELGYFPLSIVPPLYRTHIKMVSSLDVKQLGLITILGGVFSLIYLPFSSTLPDWFVNKIPSMIYYISPLFATVCLMCLSILIERYLGKYIVGFFSTCGKQSFIILAFHQIIVMIVGRYLPSKMTILIMIVSLTFLVWYIPKYLPWMLGKTNVNKSRS